MHQLLEDATVAAAAATRILLGVLGVLGVDAPAGDVMDAWSLTARRLLRRPVRFHRLVDRRRPGERPRR